MKKQTKVLTGAAVAALVVAGAASAVAASTTSDPPAERASERAFTDTHRADARVSQAEAERRATAARPGRIVETHLEDEGHGLRWEVKTDDGAQVSEVQVDAATGAVVSNQVDE